MPFRSSTLATAFITALLFISVTYVSCQKDDTSTGSVDTKCIDVNCNNGECFEGQCACQPGWEGFYCDIKAVDKYIGNWMALETVTASNDTTSTNAVGDTNSYMFHIVRDGNSVLTYKIFGLMDHQSDTITVTLGHPVTRYYEPNRFFFESASHAIANVYFPNGGGKVASSGALMDSLGYRRWYDGVDAYGDTFVLKETVSIAAQKAQ
jgi:hypothetical protein